MRITEKRTEPKTNIDYYYGEFGFNAVNEEDENDIIVAKNGRFEKLRLGRQKASSLRLLKVRGLGSAVKAVEMIATTECGAPEAPVGDEQTG